MNEQEKFWAEKYANGYIAGNSQFDYELGATLWNRMLEKADRINSILECGCNIGKNIRMLNMINPSAEKSVIEISRPAFEIATKDFDFKYACNESIVSSHINDRFDLVFTMGVLIHVHPDDLIENLKKVFEYSKKYILIGEYFNRTPVSIEYRGEQNKLFKADFGKILLNNFNVKLLDYGFFWGHLNDSAGFDDITWWLFERNPN